MKAEFPHQVEARSFYWACLPHFLDLERPAFRESTWDGPSYLRLKERR